MAAVIAFQLALAAGLPLGEATMGGRAATVEGVLEPRYRAIALGSAVVLVLAAWIVLARAGLVPIFLDDQALVWSTWVVAGFLALNTATNLSGRHPLERWGLVRSLWSQPFSWATSRTPLPDALPLLPADSFSPLRRAVAGEKVADHGSEGPAERSVIDAYDHTQGAWLAGIPKSVYLGLICHAAGAGHLPGFDLT